MNSTKIPIDELYEQLTAILQKEEYAKSSPENGMAIYIQLPVSKKEQPENI